MSARMLVMKLASVTRSRPSVRQAGPWRGGLGSAAGVADRHIGLAAPDSCRRACVSLVHRSGDGEGVASVLVEGSSMRLSPSPLRDFTGKAARQLHHAVMGSWARTKEATVG